METMTIPPELNAAVGSDARDFTVEGKRSQPLKKSLSLVFFGLFWTAFSSIFVVVLFGPILFGKEVHFEANGVPTVAGPDNLGPLLWPGIFIGFFILIGLAMILGGIYSIYKKGGYFVGTPTRLIHFQNGTIKSIDWEQFTGNVEVTSTDVSLEMRTGKMVSKKNGPDQYVPHVVYISGIENAFGIGELCRKRIKENDPTPPSSAV